MDQDRILLILRAKQSYRSKRRHWRIRSKSIRWLTTMREQVSTCRVKAGRIHSRRGDNRHSFLQMWSTSNWINKKRTKRATRTTLSRIQSKFTNLVIFTFYFQSIVFVLPSSCFQIRILRVFCNYIRSAECARKFTWRHWCKWTKSVVRQATEEEIKEWMLMLGMPSQWWGRLWWLIQTRTWILLMSSSGSKMREQTKKR